MATIASVEVSDEQEMVLSSATAGYRFIAIANNGTATAYLKFFADGDDVTDETGIPMIPGASMFLDQDDSPILNNGIYAVCRDGESTTLAVQAY